MLHFKFGPTGSWKKSDLLELMKISLVFLFVFWNLNQAAIKKVHAKYLCIWSALT